MLPYNLKAPNSSNPHSPCGTFAAGLASRHDSLISAPVRNQNLPAGGRQSIRRQTRGGSICSNSSSRCLQSSTIPHISVQSTPCATLDNQSIAFNSRVCSAVAFSQVQQSKASSSSSSSSTSRGHTNAHSGARSRLSSTENPSARLHSRTSSRWKSNAPNKKHIGTQQQQQQQQQQDASSSIAWYEVPASSHKHPAEATQAKDKASEYGKSSGASSCGADVGSSTSSRRADVDSNSTASSSSSSNGVSNFASQLPDHQQQQLHQYLDHMLEVNKHMNLTAIRDPDEAWQRHIEDSLALLPAIDKYLKGSRSSSTSVSSRRTRTRRKAAAAADADANDADLQQQQQQQPHALTVIDVGTGAGLPGMVFAVVRPHWKVTLLDSLRKRCDFLQATADMLGLTNVTVVWSRAEDGGNNPQHREVYDLAVARAVAELRVLSELCLPFVKEGGLWVAAKGANPEDEVAAADNALSKLGGELLAIEKVNSWAPEGQRTAVVVKKCSKTPSKYPRTAGTPGRKPL